MSQLKHARSDLKPVYWVTSGLLGVVEEGTNQVTSKKSDESIFDVSCLFAAGPGTGSCSLVCLVLTLSVE